jgi:cytochrome c nitrite reductase small subunit
VAPRRGFRPSSRGAPNEQQRRGSLSEYLEKGRQGAKDVYAFSSGHIPVAIRASEKSKVIIQSNCVRCHEETVESVVMGAQPFDRYCWDCHRNVSHGTRGASAVPYQDAILYPVR